MAISLTTLNGTDSIAASRITINDNFATVGSALNSLLSIIDIATGLFDNSTFGSNNNIITGNIVSNGNTGVSINSGSLSIATGNITLGAGKIDFGVGTNVTIKKTSHATGPASSVYVLDVAGYTGAAAGASASGNVGAFVIPRQSTAFIQSIQNPEVGSVVFNNALNTLCYCVASGTTSGATGTWMKLTATGATYL
jgi:hypothetical protein